MTHRPRELQANLQRLQTSRKALMDRAGPPVASGEGGVVYASSLAAAYVGAPTAGTYDPPTFGFTGSTKGVVTIAFRP
jgi:hypothetical protein